MTAEIRQKIAQRTADLTEWFIIFRNGLYDEIQAQHGGSRSGLSLNATLLREVAERYFEDLEKERIEHRCGLFNGYRQAAFTLKWLMQLRPLQTTCERAEFLTANEDFALSVAFRMLKLDEQNVPVPLYEYLAYVLRFDRLEDGLLMAVCMQLNPNLAASAVSKEDEN